LSGNHGPSQESCGENGPNENPNGIISTAYNILEK
jgi:hypothetical protein